MFHLPPDIQLKNLVLSSTRHLDTFLNLVLGLIFNLLRTHKFMVDADTFETGSLLDVSSNSNPLCSFAVFLRLIVSCDFRSRRKEEKESKPATTHFSCPLPLA